MGDDVYPLVVFRVPGRAVPAGSKRAFGKAIVDVSGDNLVEWKYRIHKAAQVSMDGRNMLPRGVPIELHVRFFIQRPQSHFGTGKNAGLLKPSAPAHPTSKPDATKLLRAVEDALTGVVWEDDAQIVVQRVAKCYGDPGVEVRAWRR